MSSPSPFGQNEWLVEEMYRKFREDPSSVDPSWHEFLVDYSPEPTTESQPTGGDGRPAPTAVAPPPHHPNRRPPPPPQPHRRLSRTTGASVPAKATASPTSPQPTRHRRPKAPAKATAGPTPADGDELQVLRGAAAAVVKNMSASLEVPTATSVRAIPAKLMIDNRIVINNHLKRTRGGKISFTHLIGYALVQAVKKFPNMNRHFAEVDGKPNAVTPEHINLGLAIDLPGKDGNRQLVVAAHQEAARPCGSASSSPPTRTSCGGPATAS